MSDVMERTLASIPRLLSSTLLGGGRGGQTPVKSQPSQSFQNFLRSVEAARGRSEEAAVVQRELRRIKQHLEHPDSSVARWCEVFPEIIYCSVLGYDVSFSYIYALKITASDGSQKKMGYLAATLLLDPVSEITILITGTLLKDLMSSNMMENLMALNAAAELASPEQIPFLLPPVVKLLEHRQAMVRARALHCMHAFFHRAPGLMQSHVPQVKGMLGDRDPGVLMAAVTIVESLAEAGPEEFLALGSALVSILQQIRAYKFPVCFSYHGLPLPWLQVKLLKILAHLAPLDDGVTSSVMPLLSNILRDTIGKEMMSLAILEESLMTIAALAKADQNEQAGKSAEKEESVGLEVKRGSEQGGRLGEETKTGEGSSLVQGNRVSEEQRTQAEDNDQTLSRWKPLLEEASRCVASFLGADLPNLRYIGVKVLTQLVAVSAELAVPHKDRVVNCLNDPDLIVRRQTLTLLHHMAVQDNYKAICTTMLKHVHKGHFGNEADIIDMVVDISHRLNSDPEWYLHTIFPLLSKHLNQTRLDCIMDSILGFFTRASQHPAWPQFPDFLFKTMVDTIINCEGKGDPSVKLSLHVLRFIALSGCKTFPREEFLASCVKLLTCAMQTVELKEQVVLCVQALLLRGHLDKAAVLAWAGDLLGKCDHSSPCQYQLRLSELWRLASLNIDLTSVPTPKSVEGMDFSLSFLDSSVKAVKEDGQLFLRTLLHSSEGQEADGRLLLPQQGNLPSASSKSDDMSSTGPTPSHDNSPVYAGASLYSESGREDGSPSPSVLKTVPAIQQRWTRHGFNNNADERKPLPLSPQSINSTEDTQTAVQAEDVGGEEDDLAQALFEGLSPPSTVMPSSGLVTRAVTGSGSQKSSTSSGFDSSSSQNSAGASSPDTPLTVDPNYDLSPSTATAAACQYAGVHSKTELGADSVHEEMGVLFAPAAPANSWKALHTTRVDNQAKVNTEIQQGISSAAFEKVMSSNMESVSRLSISDDSLENDKSCSFPDSPTKTLHSPSGPFEETELERGGMDDTVLSLFLETQMMEKESFLQGEERSADSGGESLYSEFEILAQSSPSQDSRVIESDTALEDEHLQH